MTDPYENRKARIIRPVRYRVQSAQLLLAEAYSLIPRDHPLRKRIEEWLDESGARDV